MKQLAHVRWPRLNKRTAAIVTGVVFMVVVSLYALWSKQVWDHYSPGYQQWHQDVKRDIAATEALPAVSEKERAAVLAAFRKVTDQIDRSRQAVCVVNPLVQWQQDISRQLQRARADCETMVAKVTKLDKSLIKVTTYVADDQSLAQIMAAVPQPDELADDRWSTQVVVWTKATEAIKNLSVGDSFKPVQQLAIKQTSSVKVAWEGVVVAHTTKDKTAYLAAQAALATAIDDLDVIVIASQRSLADLTHQLEIASSAAF